MTLDPLPARPITREFLAALRGPVLVEFGAQWCGICRSFAPQLHEVLGQLPQVQHIRIEDGKGQPLGRDFGVTLWPTLVFLRDGVLWKSLVRPSPEETLRAIQDFVGGAG